MAAPAVVLVDEDNASGMAEMLAGLLESNLRDFPSRRAVATRTRGEVVFTAADRDLSVTVSFTPGRIEVRDGVGAGAPVVAAPWMTMAQVCSGTTSPWTAWRSGELRVEGLKQSPTAGAAAWVLSVPSSFYEQGVTIKRDRRSAFVLIATTIAVTALAVLVVRRHKQRNLS